ncbi:MAG: NAD(P)/FAD-dependent oxidoreductase [Nocardioides sp.]
MQSSDLTYDAVVVGAGPNGLVAANRLADAGWSVLVLESRPHVGGAVHSDRSVASDFEHDMFSSFYPLGAASPALRSLRLEDHGLVWRHAPAVLGHPMPDGSWALQHRDREVTASLLDELCAGDGEAWLALCARWDRIGDALVEGLLTPFPPVRATGKGLLRLKSAGGLDFVRMLLTPALDDRLWPFRGVAPRLLIAGNAAHSDIPLDAPGSGLMGLLMTLVGQVHGFPVPEGGSSRLADALVRRFEGRGGQVRCGAPVERIEVDGGRATAVRVADGTRVLARRAVLGAVVAPILYERLLDPDDVPARVRRGMWRFQLDPSTVKVDWALDGPVPWETTPEHPPGTVHVADSMAQLSESVAQVGAGFVPERPFLLVGQMSTTDPTRSPAGTEALWAYTHVPQQVRGDRGDDGITGTWDADERERFADRMQARLEERAPGFSSTIRARRVLGPRELEAENPNLIGGAVNGGTTQLHQELIFRPVPGWGRAETGIRGLYLASASAHPGGAVHGAPGMNAARAALAHHRWSFRH